MIPKWKSANDVYFESFVEIECSRETSTENDLHVAEICSDGRMILLILTIINSIGMGTGIRPLKRSLILSRTPAKSAMLIALQMHVAPLEYLMFLKISIQL